MKKYFFFYLIFLFFSFNCGPENPSSNNENVKSDSLNIPEPTENLGQATVYSTYKIPLPVDIINFLKDTKSFYKELLNELENAEKHSTSISKALNLGIYTADLAYCSILNNAQSSLDYYQMCYKFSNDLEINDGYTESYFRRMNKNLDNNDSLIAIANESYDRACLFLEKQGRNNILPFVVIGGWYESLALVILSGRKAKIPKNKVRDFILSQQKGVENLINYLYDVQIETSAFAYNKELTRFIEHLKKLKSLYQDYRISQDSNVYNVLVEEILNMRNLIVNNVIR